MDSLQRPPGAEEEEEEEASLTYRVPPLQLAAEKLRHAGPGHILIATDITWWKDNRQVFSKAFDVAKLIEFVTAYCRPGTERFKHESLPVDAPVHPYIDVDFKASDEGGPEKISRGDEHVVEIIRAARELMRVKIGIQNVPDPKLLSCNRPGKYSKHIIFDTVWMANIRHVGALFASISNIDLQPYGGANTKTCMWMRMPYSEKLEEPGYPVLPDGVPPPPTAGMHRWPALDPANVLPYMISWIGNPNTPQEISTILLPMPKQIYRMAECYMSSCFGSSPSPPGEGGGSSRERQIIARAKKILEYLNVTRGPFTASEPAVRPGKTGAWSSYVDPGIYCASHGVKHQRQRTYIGSDDCRAVYYRCPDKDCRIRVYFPEDFTCIAYGSL